MNRNQSNQRNILPLHNNNNKYIKNNNQNNQNNQNNLNDKLNMLYQQQQQLQQQILELQNMTTQTNTNQSNKIVNNMNIQSIINNKNTDTNNIYVDLKSSSDLGSILSNIAAALAFSYKYNMNIKLTNYEKKYDLFNSINTIDNNLINNYDEIIEPSSDYYNKLKINNKSNCLLNGEFKSFKYIDKYIDKIKLYLFDNIDTTVTTVKEMFNSLKNNKKTILLYLNNIEEEYYIDALDIYFKNNNVNEYKIFLLNNKFETDKYTIEIINENDPEKILILMTLFDHYIIYSDKLALLGYYFRDNLKATLTLLPNNNSDLLNYDDIIPDTKQYIDTRKKLDNTYIINLEFRKDNKIRAIKEVTKIVNQPEIYKAPNEDNNINISLSHINILKKAIELELEYVVIAHDNIKILNESYCLYSINKIMKNTNWDVIIVSGIGVDTKINDFYSQVISMQSPIIYIANKKYYNKLLNNLNEGYNKLLKHPNNIIYLLDEYWKRLQKDDEWYSITSKYIYIQDNYYNNKTNLVDFRKLFNIMNTNICDYLDYIPIIEMANINMIYDINPIFYNCKYIIINLYCSKVERTFIKYSIDLLKKNNYELIHLQKPYHKIFKDNNTDIFTNISNNSSGAYLLNNYLLKKIINNPNYIVNNIFNYNMVRSAELKIPIFFDCNDNEWINYYNKIN